VERKTSFIKLDDFITPQLIAEKVQIGVIVDGNGNPTGTFASVQAKLAELAGQTVSSVGSWTNGVPNIGIFITPDGVARGEIETLVWRAWAANPENSSVRTCIEQYRDCMAAAGFNAHSPDKGLISSLLAIRNDDDPRLGPGARTGVFDFAAPEFAQLQTFLSGF
jgi:hypothetical protein